MNVTTALKKASVSLESISDTARLDAELLLCFVLQKNRSYLYAHSDDVLTDAQQTQFEALIEQRSLSLPIAYLTGEKEFWSFNLKVSTHTLIPRPATESLVEFILKQYPNKPMKVCDLGTGTGAIAIALAKERPNWHITAIDIQPGALAIASANARRIKCHNIEFVCSNWFSKIPTKHFDLIISNPPYIDAKDEHLSQGDVQHEPKKALVSDYQGLSDLHHLIRESKKHLHPQGILILEHGHQQQQQVLDFMQQHDLHNISGHLDEEQNQRFCIGYASHPH